ncbi:hypothetical protein U1294_07930 [Enterococcus cecorum]|uniref:Uncharacterized protein n=2 Tax=Enterococcus cecorum TaxID=44008 RepID=A0AAW9JXL4_9ENTE|nr:hypothetical protein [Enterococcus cecorum]MDZ5577096.1 hypothetical protein [Enterococcus cecorum]MDZ5598156.1 hypothetical protein [Enterococcus cecorum]
MHEQARPLPKMIGVLFRIQKNSNSSIKNILLRLSLKKYFRKKGLGCLKEKLYLKEGIYMKVKGIKKVVSYYKNMCVGNTLEVYYRPSKNELFSEEFVGKGWINFSEDSEAIVIGFYTKGRNNLTMEILKKDLEEILRKEMNEND